MSNDIHQGPIVIASDHAGYKLKAFVEEKLTEMWIAFEDVGAHDYDPADDYTLFTVRAAKAVSEGTFSRGIALCGSGIGTSMIANRFRGVRAALCITPEMARLSRQHNNSNILVMGERITTLEVAEEILKEWLKTPFEGGRHEKRIQAIDSAVC